MIKLSKPGSVVLCAAAALLLAACSTTPSEPASAAAAQTAQTASAASVDPGEIITGSRLTRKSTDRLVRRTDNAGAKEMERDRPPNPGPAFN